MNCLSFLKIVILFSSFLRTGCVAILNFLVPSFFGLDRGIQYFKELSATRFLANRFEMTL